jgi:hypothetical protein
MKNQSILFLTLFVFLSACAGITSKNQGGTIEDPLKIDIMDRLVLGSTQDDVIKVVGEPNKKFNSKNYKSIKDNLEYWFYPDKVGPVPGADRIALTFDTNTKKLIAKEFSLRSRDPEIKLSYIKARFKDSQFKIVEAPWCHTDYQPDEAYYIDSTRGITVVLRSTRQEVDAITWEIPNSRDLASEASRCPVE